MHSQRPKLGGRFSPPMVRWRETANTRPSLRSALTAQAATTILTVGVNVYNDSGDGTDKSVALSVLKSVTAGTHTFYFLGSRYNGAGTVLLYDPTLTVITRGARVHLPLVLKGQ